jgi:hypothetical protein
VTVTADDAKAIKARAPKKKHPYYNFDKLWSYAAFFMFVVGGRGLGKTYGAKKKAIRDFIRNGDQFIYMRRFKSDLKGIGTFFDDLLAGGDLDPEYDYRVNGNVAEISGVEFREDKKREWRVMGYFIALSTAQSYKSIPFPEVKTIIFDEFIIEKGLTHYLPDESKVFTNFYSTVDRWQDKTRVLFLANSVSIMNPYFLAYDIKPADDGSTEWVKKMPLREGGHYMVAHFADSAVFTESVMKTKFGQFIAGTDYADYAVGNNFGDNHSELINSKDPKARYRFTVQTRKGYFSVWYSSFSNLWYAQANRPGQETIMVTEEAMMRADTQLMLRSDKLSQYLRAAFRRGDMWFDTPQTRNSMIEIFK